jgi:polar amino acid transport system substrate-binding protein
MRRSTILSLGLIAILAAACSNPGASASPAASSVPSASAAAASVAPSVAPTPNACAAANLKLVAAGKLTIGTDNPAYPPYFAENADGHKTAPWEFGDPTNGQGFESAVAYAVAKQLGFTTDQVVWAYTPFDTSYKPGPKTFDFDINQVSFSAERASAVDMSDGYYFVNQAVVSLTANAISSVTSISGLKAFKFGAQVGTTSYKTITDTIQPTAEASVYNDNDAAIAALNAKQIDAIVVDLPTAFFMTGSGQIKDGKVVGQFASPTGANAEHFSIVLPKGSALTACVNGAIGALKTSGSLDAITKEWLSDKVSAPVFTP